MDQNERLDWLIAHLAREYKGPVAVPESFGERRSLLRALVNVRPPRPVSDAFLRVQDAFLQEEARGRGIVRLSKIPAIRPGSDISLWRGDITRLEADAIVNAANSALLGCFAPGHGCIDNAIHTFAGVQLRQACARLMRGREEPAGAARITPAYNLPCRFVLHTVGPIVWGEPTPLQREQLAGCYRACLALASENGLRSVAFCCVSTGEYRFPRRAAARIAVDAVREFLARDERIQVILNVFTDEDQLIYEEILEAL